jgi:hypothetical protein
MLMPSTGSVSTHVIWRPFTYFGVLKFVAWVRFPAAPPVSYYQRRPRHAPIVRTQKCHARAWIWPSWRCAGRRWSRCIPCSVQEKVFPRLVEFVGEISLVVEVAIWAEVVSGAWVVDGEAGRWPAGNIGMQRIWSRFRQRLVWVWHVEGYRRLGQSERRRLQRCRRWGRGARWWECSSWGAEDVVAAEVGPLEAAMRSGELGETSAASSSALPPPRRVV